MSMSSSLPLTSPQQSPRKIGKAEGKDAVVDTRSRGLPSLVDIATTKCIQHVGRLTDVGTTPFHLMKPILRRMNAKQLDSVESTSPSLCPESDQLWSALIVKDFPDRPSLNSPDSNQAKPFRNKSPAESAKFKMMVPHHHSMPNKFLYNKYTQERDEFRKDSAARLRNITEKLKMQKSANSIVSVPELLKDPTVRKSRIGTGNTSGYHRQYSNPARSSILNRARRDIQHRSLMFKNPTNTTQSPPSFNKRYDPYAAFKYKNQSPPPAPASSSQLRQSHHARQQPHRPLARPQPISSLSQPSISTSPQVPIPPPSTPPPLATAASSPTDMAMSPTTSVSSPTITPSTRPAAPEENDAPPIKRRKPSTASIFLTANRSRRKPPLPPMGSRLGRNKPNKTGTSNNSPAGARGNDPNNSHDDSPKITPIKSSIFS